MNRIELGVHHRHAYQGIYIRFGIVLVFMECSKFAIFSRMRVSHSRGV